MKPTLDFEKPLAEMEERIEALRHAASGAGPRVRGELRALEEKAEKLRRKIYSGLTSWQKTQLSRHPARPTTLDYLRAVFTDFEPLHGDRLYGDDPAIVGGLARFHGTPVLVVGHQKARGDASGSAALGMPMPEGFRKALRLMRLGERFAKPIITFVDTTGAFPGPEAEERGQAEAIARNLREMSALRVPIVSVVIGEGGSGGALALCVADRILMLEYAIFTVISPEGCAAILWREGERAEEAAEALKLTARDILELGVIDAIVPEPPGGAHRDPKAAAAALDAALARHLREVLDVPMDELVKRRYDKFRRMGKFIENPKGAGPPGT
jgi:acetyl-CoA carboxylase carboxyl transferase subunit alpha